MKNKYDIPQVKTFEYTKIIGIENIEFGKHIILDDYVLIYARDKIRIDDYVHIASFTSITGGGELIMESFTAVSSGCRIVTGTDDFTGEGFGNSTINDSFRNVTVGKICIKKFAIVGANSVILPNVTIGEGASVGAGSVVTKDLEAWGIYIGNKKIGERNKEEVMKNYKKFIALPVTQQIGNLFKN